MTLDQGSVVPVQFAAVLVPSTLGQNLIGPSR
jgi:hypothetical protein